MDRTEFVIDVAHLLRDLVPTIADDYRASGDASDDSDAEPGILVTIGADASGWSYQTGDNSYTGGAYGFATWALVYLYRDSDCAALADDAAEELSELAPDDEPIFDSGESHHE
jgi:hypothetical protein